MSNLEEDTGGDRTRYVLDGRELENGDEVLLRLRGNKGWEPVTIDGLPDTLRIRFQADNGKSLVTSLPFDAEIRWPG